MKNICLILCEIHKKLMLEMAVFASRFAESLGLEIKDVYWAPGSLEIPLTISNILDNRNLKKKYDGMIVFGMIRKGRTKHGEVLAHQTTGAIIDLQLKHKMPMAVSILGPGCTEEYAKKKAKKTAEKAVRVVCSMIEQAETLRRLK